MEQAQGGEIEGEPEQEEQMEQVVDMEQYAIPQNRGIIEYRACLNCGIIRTFGQYYHEGCPNCETFLKYKNNLEKVVNCSTLEFRGLFHMLKPFKKWQTRIRDIGEVFAAGFYAAVIYGTMPSRFVFQLLSEDDNDTNGLRCL